MSATLTIKAQATVGAFALDVDVTAPPGVSVLFGPSGAGKSSVLHLAAGLLAPSRGEIRLGDEVWASATRMVPPERRRAALVFQSLALFPHLNVAENVAFGVRERAQKKSLVHEALARLGITALAQRAIKTLSGGEAQRVALARAIAMRPSVLLLDEPFNALDRPLRLRLGQELRAVVEALAVPALLVTHDDEEARRVGDRVIALHDGKTHPISAAQLG